MFQHNQDYAGPRSSILNPQSKCCDPRSSFWNLSINWNPFNQLGHFLLHGMFWMIENVSVQSKCPIIYSTTPHYGPDTYNFNIR